MRNLMLRCLECFEKWELDDNEEVDSAKEYSCPNCGSDDYEID